MIRVLLICCLVLSLLIPLVAYGDLYTGWARSIDWLVDSSDEIVLLQVDRQGEADLQTIVAGTLKRRLTPDEFREATSHEARRMYRIHKKDEGMALLQFRVLAADHWVNAGWHSERPAEWLLFLRTDGQAWRLVHAINLTRPRETSSTAAITATGVALRTKEQILAAVSARINLNRPMPATCDRELLELRRRGQFEDWYQETRREEWYLSTPQVETILGGFHVPISNDYWDTPDEGDLDEDLHLGRVLVPADEQYARPLFECVEAEKHPSDHDLLAMLNYSGKEAERILQQIVEADPGGNLTASRLLYYLRYRRDPAHPFDDKLIGRWELLGTNERVELEFHKDHTCVVNVRPTRVTVHLPGYQPVDGRGYWAIRDGKLWIGRSQIQRDGKWIPARREFFPPKKMLKTEAGSITLEGGPPMKRRPPETSGSP